MTLNQWLACTDPSALQDPPAYCDCREIIEHLKQTCHLPECWVLTALLGDGETK